MGNDNTKVKQLLDKCKDLTEEHIIQSCEKYHDTLTTLTGDRHGW